MIAVDVAFSTSRLDPPERLPAWRELVNRVYLPLDIAPLAIFWAPQEIAIDTLHHAIYALATGIAYEQLGNERGARNGGSSAT